MGTPQLGRFCKPINNENTILLLRDYGTADYYLPIVTEIKIESGGSVVITPNTNCTPNWKHIVSNLSKRPWAQNLKQIPATVIDKGILRNVPYVSFRGGEDYEVNIYGDLDNPAGFEVGVYRKLLADDAAKGNCLQFVESLLCDLADKETLGKLKRENDSATRDGLTFEITPPTDEEAYLGWWISIYDEKRLNLARASESELKQITVPRTPTTSKPTMTQENRGWSRGNEASATSANVPNAILFCSQHRQSATSRGTQSHVKFPRFLTIAVLH